MIYFQFFFLSFIFITFFVLEGSFCELFLKRGVTLSLTQNEVYQFLFLTIVDNL